MWGEVGGGRGDWAWPWSSVHVRSGHPELELCSTSNGKTICVSKKASGSHLEKQGPVGAHEFQSWYSTVATSRVWSQKTCISVLASSLMRCVTLDKLLVLFEVTLCACCFHLQHGDDSTLPHSAAVESCPCSSSPNMTLVSLGEKHQTCPDWGTFYRVSDQESSKPWRSLKTGKVWETVTTKRKVRRRDDWI